MSSQRPYLYETSEKTIENNILSDISNLIQRSGAQVTIISPTQQEELDLGFDDLIYGLPKGRTLALQFKKPHEYHSVKNSDFVKFEINTHQLQKLLDNFRMGQAFYIFTPLTRTYEIVQKRSNLMNLSRAWDVFNIPNGRKITQKTRTVKMKKLNPVYVEIADPRIFETSEKIESIKSLCSKLVDFDLGFSTKGIEYYEKAKPSNQIEEIEKIKKIKIRGLYYVHISKK